MDSPQYIMQTDTLRVTVLPALGGKIASLRWLPDDLELLQSPLNPYRPLDLTMGFHEGDAGGFDECLPSVAACSLETPAGLVQVPDHGDFWRLPWEASQAGNEIHMAATGVSLPLRLERTLRLSESELQIDYLVRNLAPEPLQYAWSAHPLLAVDPDDRVLLPPSISQVHVEGSAAGRLGRKGTVHPWPRTSSVSGDPVDLSLAGHPDDRTGDKVFAPAPPEGWAALLRPRHGLRIEVSFDPRQIPWLGLWLCYGGWPEHGARRQQCVAIEPCTAPVDSLAEAMEQGWARPLAPQQYHRWTISFQVRRVSLSEKVNGCIPNLRKVNPRKC